MPVDFKNMNKKTIIIFVSVCVALVILLILLIKFMPTTDQRRQSILSAA